MEQGKKLRLEEKGWRVGSAADFLSLSTEEAAQIESRIRFSRPDDLERARPSR